MECLKCCESLHSSLDSSFLRHLETPSPGRQPQKHSGSFRGANTSQPNNALPRPSMYSGFASFTPRGSSYSLAQWLLRALQTPFNEPVGPYLSIVASDFPVLGSWWILPALGLLYSRKYSIDRQCFINTSSTQKLHRATQLIWAKFTHKNVKMPLKASTPTAPRGLLVYVLAEQTLSNVAGETSCSIVCCLVEMEKSPVLNLPPGKCRDFCQFSMSWSKLNCFNLPVVGWFCLWSCKLDGDLLLGSMDIEQTATVTTAFVQSWSLAEMMA